MADPVGTVRRPAPTPGSRTVSEKALKAIWEAASGLRRRFFFFFFFFFFFLSGTNSRSSRWTGARSTPAASGTCQPRGNKVKRAHPVPLSALALRVLGPRKESGPVFPTVKDTKLLQDRVRKLTGLDGEEPFIWHGLKHLMETGLAKLRVSSDIADMLLDHAPRRGTGRIYNHSTALDYRDQTQPAAEAWAGYIAKLVQPAEAVAVLR